MNPLTLLALVREPEFVRGLGAGLGALVVMASSRGQIGWFLSWGMAAAVGLVWTEWRDSYAALVTWVMLPAAVWVFVAGAGIGELRRDAPRRAILALFALSVLGVWGTVPDTEGAAVLMGVTAGMAPAVWPLKTGEVGAFGPFVAFAVVAIVTVADGAPRPGSIVGALGAAGMLLVAPLVLRMRRTADTPVSVWLLVATQIAFVIVSGRLAGRMTDAGPALVAWAVAAVAFAVLWSGLQERLGRTAGQEL